MLTAAIHLSGRWARPAPHVYLRRPPSPAQPATLTPASLRRDGELFAAVFDSEKSVTLMTDHLRSWPLFYAVRGGEIHVADNAFDIANAVVGTHLDMQNAAEFLHAGFVVGGESLWEGVHQVPAGSTVRIDRRSGKVSVQLERRLRLREPGFSTVDDFTTAFDAAVDEAMARLYERADGRLIVLPLSAGLDSRLLATRLARDRYPRILTFTYGLPGSGEAEASRQIAQSLGLPWTMAEIDRSALQRSWNEASTVDFLRSVSGGASLPHIQDWYALKLLVADGSLPPGSVIIPGHTVVSASRDVALRDRSSVSRHEVMGALAPWLFDLRSAPEDALQLPHLQDKLAACFREIGFDGSRRSTLDAVRWFWQRERQAKYILNSVRAYEFFDLDWALPLHDLALWDLYEAGPDSVIESRDWYRGLVERDYTEAVGDQSALAASPRSGAARRSPLRIRAHSIASRTGLLTYHTRVHRVRAVVDHPLGFDALLTGVSRPGLAVRTLRGRTPLGIYAELFLQDRWVPGSNLFGSRSL